MFKKVLAGFFVMALALALPITSDAGVKLGDNDSLYGDFRMRFEFDDKNGGGTDKRERPRIRLRLGGKHQTALDNVAWGWRLATGSNSLNSPHQTLETAGSNNSNFGLDRAFATVKFLESGVVIVGKQGYPLWQQTEQFWDEDIQPEGFAVAYTASLGDAGSLTAAAAYYYLVNNDWEDSLFDNDTATVWQVAWKGKVQDLKFTVAGTGLHTTDGDDSGDWAAVNVDNDVAFYMISGQVKGKVDNIKWQVGADYHLSNADYIGQSDDHDSGFVVQGRVGWDQWQVRYYYYDIEELAAPSYAGIALSQDNFPNSSNKAPMGFEGHRIQVGYKFAKNVNVDVRYYIEEGKSDNYGYGEAANAERNRLQVNFNLKF